jgi:hypothetical protein
MSGQVEQYVTSAKGELTIQIEARPYIDNFNAIEVICTMNSIHGFLKKMVFREVRDL